MSEVINIVNPKNSPHYEGTREPSWDELLEPSARQGGVSKSAPEARLSPLATAHILRDRIKDLEVAMGTLACMLGDMRNSLTLIECELREQGAL